MMWDVHSNPYGDYLWNNTFAWSDCETTAECDVWEFCNFEYGTDGGSCERCPGETDQACDLIKLAITGLGTDECKRVCVKKQSEFIM